MTLPASSLSDGIRVAVGCYGTDGAVCPSGSASYARIHSATFTLADDVPPTVSDHSGSLTTGDVMRGTQSIVFGATDAGGGVYRAIVSVDGQVIGAPVLDSSGGTCVDAFTGLGDSDPYQFESRTPCPATVSGAQLPLDTTRFADGDHRVAVVVEDAAGNRTPVYGPATMTIRNASTPGGSTTPPDGGGLPTSPAGTAVGTGTPNGLNATPNAQLNVLSVARTVRVRYGRATTLRGRLTTPAGTGIAGAAIDVTARTSLPGAAWRTAGSVRTDASGSFSYRIPVGASRTVRFAYRVATGDAQPVESDDVVVRVTSRVDLRLSNTRLRNGQTLRY
ncbi:MAG TPA: hypothetical protein VLB47_14945, partial [Solirubrobacteraceae bacterium]|nr:hypothetical protein [Solirubrobacteraceae bacterium]